MAEPPSSKLLLSFCLVSEYSRDVKRPISSKQIHILALRGSFFNSWAYPVGVCLKMDDPKIPWLFSVCFPVSHCYVEGRHHVRTHLCPIKFPWLAYPIISHCIQLYPIISHFIQLYPIISHCIQLYPIISHCIQLYPIISHFIQLYPIISHCIQLYPIISHCIQLYPIISSWIKLYIVFTNYDDKHCGWWFYHILSSQSIPGF